MLLRKWSEDGKSKLMSIGHNVPFDVGFITSHLLKADVWNTFVSYHSLDTIPIAQFLKLKGKLATRTPLKLGELAKALNVSVSDQSLHGAKYDTLLCVEVLKALIRS